MSKKIKVSKRFFSNLKTATFLSRRNRFVVHIKVGAKKTFASLPNSGKLGELLIPGVKLLIHHPWTATPKYRYKVAGVLAGKEPVMLDTHITNDVVEFLLCNTMVPGLKGATILKREFTAGKSRFDFLLERRGKKILCEVKSCTLFSGQIGMFPDAITARGARHVRELAELKENGYLSAVIFLIQSPHVTTFLPDYHTDIEFAKVLYEVRNDIKIIPLSIGWTSKLEPVLPVKKLTVPWHIVKREAKDAGCYIIVLHLERKKRITIGKIGAIDFPGGFYCYVGSAKKNLAKRIERHKRVRKNNHWHIDYLRNRSTFLSAYPIRTADDIECELADAVSVISNQSIRGFGCSDCNCQSHLFYFSSDPRITEVFQNVLLKFRIDRISKLIH